MIVEAKRLEFISGFCGPDINSYYFDISTDYRRKCSSLLSDKIKTRKKPFIFAKTVFLFSRLEGRLDDALGQGSAKGLKALTLPLFILQSAPQMPKIDKCGRE
jgi:hypothetical protein